MPAMPRSPHRENLRPTRWRRSLNRRHRTPMYRIIQFLVLIALAGAGAAWVADQTGDVVLSWGGFKVVRTLPEFALTLGVIVVAAMGAWAILRALWRVPAKAPPR